MEKSIRAYIENPENDKFKQLKENQIFKDNEETIKEYFKKKDQNKGADESGNETQVKGEKTNSNFKATDFKKIDDENTQDTLNQLFKNLKKEDP